MGEQGAKRQYLATLVVNLYLLGAGIFQGWGLVESYNFHLATISPMTMLIFGCFIGTILSGFVSIKFGRKIPLSYAFIPITTSCLLNLFNRNYICFQISMFLAGIFGGAVQNIAPLYLAEISEISNCRFRGAMITTLSLSVLTGQFLALIGTMFFDQSFATLCCILVPVAIAAVSFYFYFPDTPFHFIKWNDEKKAEESIRFFKNIRKTDAYQLETLEELAKVKMLSADDEIEANHASPLRWADFRTEHARKALTIGTVLVLLNTLSGVTFILYHTAVAFDQAGLHDLPLGIFKISMLSVYSTNFVAKLVAMQTVDNIGRKVLMIASSIGAALGFLIYSIYAIPSELGFETGFWPYNWIPLIGSHIVIFFSSLGIQTLTFTITTEILPVKIKDVGLTFCNALFWGLTFLNFGLYRIAIDYMGMSLIVIASAIICSVGAAYIHFKIPETKNKSHQEIMKLF